MKLQKMFLFVLRRVGVHGWMLTIGDFLGVGVASAASEGGGGMPIATQATHPLRCIETPPPGICTSKGGDLVGRWPSYTLSGFRKSNEPPRLPNQRSRCFPMPNLITEFRVW